MLGPEPSACFWCPETRWEALRPWEHAAQASPHAISFPCPAWTWRWGGPLPFRWLLMWV